MHRQSFSITPAIFLAIVYYLPEFGLHLPVHREFHFHVQINFNSSRANPLDTKLYGKNSRAFFCHGTQIVHFQYATEIVSSTERSLRDPVWIMLIQWLRSYYELTKYTTHPDRLCK